MNVIIGVVVVFGSIIGGFLLEKGHLLTLLQPVELLIIGGSALGAFIIANPGTVLKGVLKSLPKLLKSSRYKKTLYMDTLALIYDLLTKARKEGMMSLEADADDPHQSAIFSKYPAIQKDHHAVDFITDYLRLMVGGSMNSTELENLMDVELETHHDEGSQPSSAVNRVADGLPGFGIVAAVLGIVITMGHLGAPPKELGHHVAVALVGTFLGILLAYGFIGPMAVLLEHHSRDESQYYKCIKMTMLAAIQGYAPQVAVEFGRKVIFSNARPSFKELEEHVKNKER